VSAVGIYSSVLEGLSMARCDTFLALWGFMLAAVLGSQSAFAYDYFTADRDGVGQYMRSVESAHVRTVPESISNGRMNNAMADLKYTLDRFPNHPHALQMIGTVARMMKNTALAVTYYEKAITQFPQYALTRAQFGLYLVAIGNVDGGISMLKESIEMDPKQPAGYAGLAHAYAKKGDTEQAGDAARKARDLGFKGQLPPGL
jgi:predicted Zn-dependent protease